MQNKKLVILLSILIILWIGLIFVLSNTPATKSDNESKTIIRNVVEQVCSKDSSSNNIEKTVDNLNRPFRKFAHATVYFVLAVLVICLLWSIGKYKLYIWNIISIGVCFLYACSDEFHQTFVIGRSGEFGDVLIDTFGAILAIIIFDFIYKLKVNKNN